MYMRVYCMSVHICECRCWNSYTYAFVCMWMTYEWVLHGYFLLWSVLIYASDVVLVSLDMWLHCAYFFLFDAYNMQWFLFDVYNMNCCIQYEFVCFFVYVCMKYLVFFIMFVYSVNWFFIRRFYVVQCAFFILFVYSFHTECEYVCVRRCGWMYVYLHVHVHGCTSMAMYVNVELHAFECTCCCTYYIYKAVTLAHIHTYTNTQTNATCNVCMYVRMYICMPICMYVCIYKYIHTCLCRNIRWPAASASNNANRHKSTHLKGDLGSRLVLYTRQEAYIHMYVYTCVAVCAASCLKRSLFSIEVSSELAACSICVLFFYHRDYKLVTRYAIIVIISLWQGMQSSWL